jgi:hypothetical protein
MQVTNNNDISITKEMVVCSINGSKYIIYERNYFIINEGYFIKDQLSQP